MVTTRGPDTTPSDLGTTTARAVMWNYASFAAGKALVLVTMAILARLLTPEDFGIVGFATVAIAYLAVLKDLGLGGALIQRKEDVWARKRRYDGFVLLLGHPELEHSAVELVESYRGKDIVEKDFQSIKSVVELRPVYHYRDPKVLAHVTLCMLALLLQRSLEQRFRDAGVAMTASACIATLAPAQLNLRAPTNGQPIYDITRPNTDQRAILKALDLTDVANDKLLRPEITPRPLVAD